MLKNIINKNILVTGGTGFVGAHLVEKLIKEKAKVSTVYQTLNQQSYFFKQKLDKKVIMQDVDICNYEKTFNFIVRFKIDYIFHLAAQSLVEVAYANPRQTLKTNILGTINVLESARQFPNVKGIIVSSSDKAYGKNCIQRYKETDPLEGDHPYEVSKSSADLIAKSYFKTYGLPVATTRFGNIYGEGDLNFSRIMPGIMEAIIKKESLNLRSNGKFIRDYLYIKDVVNGYLLLIDNIQKVKGESFNFGSKDTLSVLQLINLVEKKLGKKIRYKIMNNAKNEINNQSLDYTKINKMVGWQPKTKISQAVNTVYMWYKKNIG